MEKPVLHSKLPCLADDGNQKNTSNNQERTKC